jgi:hypothetical protein
VRRREQPEPEALPPVDRAEVLRLLCEANALRESGVNLHHHPALEALGELCGVMAVYVFIRWPNDYRLSAAQLDKLADGLMRGHD